MNLHLANALKVLLVAMLLVVGMAPPAMGHRHAGGHVPHGHRSADQEDAHAHDHDGHHHHHDHGAANESVAFDGGWHLHFAWLGIELTLPQRGTSPDESNPGTSDHEVIVSLLDESSMSSPVGIELSDAHLAQLLPAEAERVYDSSLPETLRRSDLGRHESLLCDAARLERTGVRLI